MVTATAAMVPLTIEVIFGFADAAIGAGPNELCHLARNWWEFWKSCLEVANSAVCGLYLKGATAPGHLQSVAARDASPRCSEP